MRDKLSLRFSLVMLVSLLAVAVLLVAGCRDEEPLAPISTQEEFTEATDFLASHPQIRSLIDIQERHNADLLARPDVVGTAVGVDDNGQPVIKIYLESGVGKASLPMELDGAPVLTHVSGRIVARTGMGGGGGGMMGGSGCAADPKAPQNPSGANPLLLGTSGGYGLDLANGFCCGGTLGALISANGSGAVGSGTYILSNYHVLYSDTTPGGNGTVASPGDPVIQPGLIDVGCLISGSTTVGTLVSNGGSLPGNNFDAGVAALSVPSDGELLCIGAISSATTGAFVGQGVKKMGRTTGLGRGTVDGINGSFSISYEDECAGSFDFTQNYTGQIVITNSRCQFLDGGDSGSLMVEDVDPNPRAVGLLFAGSANCNRFSIAIANPIDEVLDHYGATMVGN